jgi:hypothetical protein
MGFFLTLGVWAVLWLVSYGLRKLNEKDVTIPQMEKMPRVSESDPVPMSFGRNRIEASNVLWFGGERAMTRSNPNGTSETNYFACGLFALSLSNIDVTDSSDDLQARLTLIMMNDEPPNQGTWEETPMSPGVTWYNVSIPAPEIGGYSGIAELNCGRWDMDVSLATTPLLTLAYSLDPAYNAVWANDLLESIDLSYVPPYQGVITVCLGDYQSWLPDTEQSPRVNPRFYFGRSPNVPPISFDLVNPVAIPGVDSSIMEFNDGAANPIGVLWHVLTRAWGGLGLDSSVIDLPSLEAAAQTVWDEGNSMSAVIYRPETVESVVARICDQVEGVFYQDPETLLLTFKLTREDYDLNTLPELDNDSLTGEPDFQMMTYSQTRNLIRVKFRNRYKSYKDDEVIAFDQANYETTGKVRDETIDMPWVTDPANAARIASRALRAWALPLAKVKFGVVRSTVFWTPGKVFKYTHPSNGKTFVMRVQRADVGNSTSGEVVIDAVQDRWAVGQTFVDPPDVVVDPQATPPAPPLFQDTLEAPRWLLVRHQMQVGGADPDSPRLMYLAAPNDDSSYEAFLGFDLDEFPDGREIDVVTFAGTGTISTTVTRENEPLASSVAINGMQNWTPVAATEDEIREHGYNLIQVGTGRDAEIMAFEAWTATTATSGTLGTVHRGLLGTTPRRHEVGTPVFALELRPESWSAQVLRRIGVRGLARGNEVLTAIVPAAGNVRPPRSEVETAGLTVSSRPVLPYPVADLTTVGTVDDKELGVDGVVTAEGVNLAWRRRDRLVDLITLGSDADEPSPEENVSYSVIVQKGDDAEVTIESGLTGVEVFNVAAAPAGHGDIRMAVRTLREVTTGVPVVYESWQDAFFDGEFKSWRNLWLNPGFIVDGAASFSRWTQLDGTSVTGNLVTTMALLTHYYAIGTANDGTTEWSQRVDLRGYRPKNMRATATFKIRGTSSDSDDTVEADLQSLDASNVTLQTDTDGPVAPASTLYWETRTLEILKLDEDTRSIQIRFEQVAQGEIDGTPQGAVTDPIVMVGQFTDELLSNPSLSSTSSWTVASGSFFTRSTTGSEGQQYQEASANNSVLTQTVSVPSGYLFGEAVLRVSTKATGGTLTNPTVKVEVLDGSSNVLSTMTSAGLAVDFGWWRTVVYADVPYNAASIKVTLTAVDSGTQFDDASLRIHKYLDPQHELTLDFSEPFEQEVPRSPYLWQRHHPGLPVPDLGLFPGTSTGALGTEPMLRVPSTIRRAGIYLPEFHNALEFRAADAAVVRARSDTSYANFDGTESFTVRIVFAPGADQLTYGLCGRLGATGWEIDVTAGVARCRLVGASSTKTALDAGVPFGGATFIALVYDAAANTLRCVTPTSSTFVSTVGMGSIACSGIPFCIGDASPTGAVTMNGTVVSVELWEEAVSHTDLQAAWVWGTDHWSGGASMAEAPAPNAPMACIVGSDEDGEIVGEFAYSSRGLWAVVDGERVMPFSPSRSNLIEPNPNTNTGWTTDGAPTVTLNAERGPNGRWEVVSIEGSNTDSRQVLVSLDETLPLNLSFMARRSAAGNGVVMVVEADGTTACSDPIPFAALTTWKRFDLANVPLYPGTVPAAIAWYPTDGVDATLYLAGPLWADQDAVNTTPPIAIPTTSGGDALTYATIEALDLAVQYKYEGEIEVQAITRSADLESGTFAHLVPPGADDDHLLYAVAGETRFSHKDGAGLAVVSEVTEASNWNELRSVRGRWNYLTCLDASIAPAGIVTDAGQDFDRSTTWTPDLVPFDTLEIGHTGGASQFNGGIKRMVVRAREKILPDTL